MKTKIRRPLELRLIIAAYVLAPIVNLLQMQLLYGISIDRVVPSLLSAYGPVAAVWLCTAPIVGISFWFVRRSTWYLFLVHSSLIVIDMVIKLVFAPSGYFGAISPWHMVFATAGNILLVIVIGYVLQKDFRAPYFQVLPRSFRESRRIPIEHVILINNKEFRVNDFSPTGCFVPSAQVSLHLGERLDIRFTTSKLDIACQGEVVRENDEGVGIHFLHTTPDQRSSIARTLKERYALRHEAHGDCLLEAGQTKHARLCNISVSGFYAEVPADDFAEGQKLTLVLKLKGQECRFAARVIWANPKGEDGKPVGIGCKFTGLSSGDKQLIHAEFDRAKLTR